MTVLTYITIIAVFFAVIAIVFATLSTLCFDDTDPDLDWSDNYAVVKCPHINQADYVVDTIVTCEKIETQCLDCGEVLGSRLEC
ncbi:hypothetical protein Peternella1_12 [Winogradskyella phage Peternella_1]|uniref:Transmembrane protein n=1 Tax=Winogradskyella phage Peternella_1 TaxID=2745699 RepID=A0A8E4ZK94_9CAUD|nr:hypothetical protein M1M32_gp12 [Winogradskyella phage Peternella_1]QQV91548.1 hypothetical protein Peternella1_12 [Winogradskyella phage Peternella_1]